MRILKKIIDEHGTKYLVSGLPDVNVGDRFVMQTTEEAGTEKQNRLFHKLLHEIYKSRAWSFEGVSEAQHDGMCWDDFRDLIKLKLGAGAEYYKYLDNFGNKKTSKRRPKPGEYQVCFDIPKSWRDYTKEERSETIDRVISWAEAMGMGYLCEEILKNEKN